MMWCRVLTRWCWHQCSVTHVITITGHQARAQLLSSPLILGLSSSQHKSISHIGTHTIHRVLTGTQNTSTAQPRHTHTIRTLRMVSIQCGEQEVSQKKLLRCHFLISCSNSANEHNKRVKEMLVCVCCGGLARFVSVIVRTQAKYWNWCFFYCDEAKCQWGEVRAGPVGEVQGSHILSREHNWW